MVTKPISFSERVLAAFVAFLAAAITAGIVQAGSIMIGGWVPLSWLGLFVALLALVGFVVGPAQITEVFGFLWGTTTALSQKTQVTIAALVAGAVWAAIYFSYFNQ